MIPNRRDGGAGGGSSTGKTEILYNADIPPTSVSSPHFSSVSKTSQFDIKTERIYMYSLTPLTLTWHKKITLSGCIKLGARDAQEDRLSVVLHMGGLPDSIFMGVYDGTVSDRASQYVGDKLHVSVSSSAVR